MDSEYEECVWSILRGREGWDEDCISVSEFIKHYWDDEEEGIIAAERLDSGWVLWWENERQQQQQQQQQIISLLQTLASEYLYSDHYLLQFWEVVRVEEGRPWHHHLSSSHLPFCVGPPLNKGICWYRKLCRGHTYVVDMESELGGGGDNQEQEQPMMIGGVGRAYRNKRPESTPDLRLYSTHEFPKRDEAARCGFRAYLALPLFDVPTNQCCGVLELLSDEPDPIEDLLSTLNQGLEIAGFKSTHTPLTRGISTEKKGKHVIVLYVGLPLYHKSGFSFLYRFFFFYLWQYKQQADSEILERLDLAMETVPGLYLAQVWVPCKQCVNTNNNTDLHCMKNLDDITLEILYDDILEYLKACKFHNLQIGDSSFHSNLCDLNISKNPLAHYAQRARMSHSFAISLQSLNESNQVYVIQFYLLPQVSYGGDDSVNLLSRIMEINLKSFKIESGRSRLTSANAIDCELTDSLQVMKSYNQPLPESNFTEFLGTLDSCCLRPSSDNNSVQGWVFRRPRGERLCENGSDSSLLPITVEQKIEDFMKKIAVSFWKHHKWIVQFWAPQTMEGRCYLQTSNQPYAVGCLAKGIASFRNKCMTHYYFVDDEAREEELGPPGRVFRNKHPEISPDPLHYTTNEFPIRNHVMHSSGYFALPIFGDDDELNHKCAGVLEFLGFHYSELVYIRTELEAAKLFSTHIDSRPRWLSNEQAVSTDHCRREALTELQNALLKKCIHIPQLHMANVWIPNGECVTSFDNSIICMELAFSTNDDKRNLMRVNQVRWIHVQTRKGIVGMVLASESKSCFCRNLYEFGIADQPLSHFEMNERRDACFAICLQSSHTSNLVYVLEFFLNHGPTTYEYIRSFLNFLLPMMKHELTSFKMASGKQLGEELVVEVIEFSDANELGSSESEEADLLPFKFKTVQYSQEKHQHTQEECSIVASDSERRERRKRKPRRNLSLRLLQSVSHMTEKDAAEDLGVALSTLKRACRRLGKTDWRDIARDMQPSTSNIQPLDPSLHLNVPHTNTEEKVMIKVKYEEDIIKFELCLSLGLAKLVEEVARRIKLEMGSFKLKYMDEDGDEILLTNDDDLQLCRKTQMMMDTTYIQLFVR